MFSRIFYNTCFLIVLSLLYCSSFAQKFEGVSDPLFIEGDAITKVLFEKYNAAKTDTAMGGIADATLLLGDKYMIDTNYKKAIGYFSESIINLKETGDEEKLWIALFKQGNCFEKLENSDSSLLKLKEAVEIIDSKRKTISNSIDSASTYDYPQDTSLAKIAKTKFYRNSPLCWNEEKKELQKKKIYDQTIEQSVSISEIDSAIYYLEKRNQYNIRKLRGAVPIGRRNESVDSLISLENNIARKLAKVDSALIKEKGKPIKNIRKELIDSLLMVKTYTVKDYHNVIDTMFRKYPDLVKHLVKNVDPSDFFNAKNKIPDEVAVIEYLYSDECLYIFLVTNETLIAKKVEIDEDELNDYIKVYLLFASTVKGNINSRDTKKMICNLYDILISTVQEQLEGIKYIAFIPTGKLQGFPLHAIGRYDKTLRRIKFLVEDYGIFYINNLDFIVEESVINKHKVIAFGNPDNSLEFAEEEVLSIEKIFKKKTLVYLNDEATEYNVKNIDYQNYNTLHFATHGFLDFDDFNNSYLQFADDKNNDEDGKLTLSEIRSADNLRDFELVCLSACNTAIPEKNETGWINNPATLFLDRNIKSVIATLWAVDDLATSKFIGHFYYQLKNGKSIGRSQKGMYKIDALRSAQLFMINNNQLSHPFYWAPFVLLGDWR